ncbi:hypothetical protein B0H14DRAFT_2651071 [Mycena olivaceomarginata]|nr:hypothetical protein B0H14DRAFT_2651071 [Mycena olivaceomarginata]
MRLTIVGRRTPQPLQLPKITFELNCGIGSLVRGTIPKKEVETVDNLDGKLVVFPLPFSRLRDSEMFITPEWDAVGKVVGTCRWAISAAKDLTISATRYYYLRDLKQGYTMTQEMVDAVVLFTINDGLSTCAAVIAVIICAPAQANGHHVDPPSSRPQHSSNDPSNQQGHPVERYNRHACNGMDPKHVQLHNPYKPKLLFEFIAFVAIDPRVDLIFPDESRPLADMGQHIIENSLCGETIQPRIIIRWNGRELESGEIILYRRRKPSMYIEYRGRYNCGSSSALGALALDWEAMAWPGRIWWASLHETGTRQKSFWINVVGEKDYGVRGAADDERKSMPVSDRAIVDGAIAERETSADLYGTLFVGKKFGSDVESTRHNAAKTSSVQEQRAESWVLFQAIGMEVIPRSPN